MHEQAQLRLKKDVVERLGAQTYVVLALDTYRTRVFKEENWLLGGGNGPFGKEKSLVFATPLSDPAGRASAFGERTRRTRGSHPCRSAVSLMPRTDATIRAWTWPSRFPRSSCSSPASSPCAA